MSDLQTISSTGPGGWERGESDVVTSKVTGALRERVLRRFGLDTGDVTITEETYYGGYSEYTQENSKDFTVTSGDHKVVFFADSEDDSIESGYGLSVFARFNDWLRAAEAPSELFAEWFPTPPDEDGRYVAAGKTTLYQTLRRYRGSQEFHLRDGERPSIVGITTYSNGFRGVDFERRLGIKASSLPDDMTRIVRALTDRWMPGFER